MLYVTTRNDRDAYTVHRVLREDRGPDGGLYLPFRMPVFSWEDLEEMAGLPFNGRMAGILNRLFNTNLTQWNLDFCGGQMPVEMVQLPQRVLLAQCWQDRCRDLPFLVRSLAERLRQDGDPRPSDWVQIAVRIALLFAVFTEWIKHGTVSREKPMDVAFLSGELTGPVSAWYARSWGLPIGNIILCCNENGQLWELFHRGQLRTDCIAVSTATPDGDVALPVGLERLVFAAGGCQEVARYLDAARRGGIYDPSEAVLEKLRRGLYVSVVGQQRMEAIIQGVYTNSGRLLSPYGALCYGGVLDYRVKTGESRPSMVFSEKSPGRDSKVVAAALGISPEELEQLLNQQEK